MTLFPTQRHQHMTLPRIYGDQKRGDFIRAPFGESKRPTELYPY